MNTVQMYSGKGNYVSPNPSAAQNKALIHSTADNRHPQQVLQQAETWLPLPNYESRYTLSSLGRVRNQTTSRLLKTSLHPDGYVCVKLPTFGRQKAVCLSIHWAVALVFLPNPQGLPFVRRKDGDLFNNQVTNLEWASMPLTTQGVTVPSPQPLPAMNSQPTNVLPSISPQAAAAAISAEVFVTAHQDLSGLPPAELALQLTGRLQSQPVRYATVLDGIALLRAFTPTSEAYPNANYALLFQDWNIIGLAYLPNQKGSEPHAIATHESDNRHLMRHILSLDADKVLLATRLSEEESIDEDWFKEVEAIQATAMWYGYEHLDWLMLLPNENLSYVLETAGEEMLDGGVTYEQLTEHYVGFSGNVTPTTAA